MILVDVDVIDGEELATNAIEDEYYYYWQYALWPSAC
jgi:hypothetical protein